MAEMRSMALLMMMATVEAGSTAVAMAAVQAVALAMTAMRVMLAATVEVRETAAKIACNKGNNVLAKIRLQYSNMKLLCGQQGKTQGATLQMMRRVS